MVPTRLADKDGADCPRLEFLILTRLLSTMEPAERGTESGIRESLKKQYRVFHQLIDLGCVDFDLDVPHLAQPILPNYYSKNRL